MICTILLLIINYTKETVRCIGREEMGLKQKRKNVAMLVSEFENSFTRALCEGALEGAQDSNVNIYFFPGKYLEPPYFDKERTRFDYQFNTLFEYATRTKFDAYLVELGTIATNMDDKSKKRLLKSLEGTPVILLASQMEGYPSVHFNNKTGLAAGIRHLITEHECRRIGFVSGPETNDDAIERLEVYKDVLEEQGISYDPGRVVYGNFSKYSTEVVEDLLDRNPDLDAVVFANDSMAIGGYQVFEKRGIRVGRDISVMGFDDDKCALLLEPNLTTVHADASSLGYQAIVSLEDFLSKKESNIVIESTLVQRQSCGCQEKDYSVLELSFEDLLDERRQKPALKRIEKFLFEHEILIAGADEIRKQFEVFFYASARLAGAEGTEADEALREMVLSAKSLSRKKLEPFTKQSRLNYVFDYIYHLLRENMKDDKELRDLSDAFFSIYQDVANHAKRMYEDIRTGVGWLNYITTTFTRDILNYAIGDDRAFHSVVDKLAQLSFRSAYLCRFKNDLKYEGGSVLQIPDEVLLKSYQEEGRVITPAKSQQRRSMDNLFSSLFQNREDMVAAVVTLLFSGFEQYGFLVFEINEENMAYVSPAMYQTSASVKTIELLKMKEENEKELKKNLETIREANAILDELSKSDELTQVYNRRGFLTTVQHQIVHPDNLGKKAVMVYADMNDLKIINDKFGHDDGDYSLRKVAKILTECFSGYNGIVGRFGGDEFCAFCISEEEDIAQQIRRSITEKSDYENNTSDKPYFVSMSLGIREFVCDRNLQIQELIDQADTELYEDKKKKKRSVMK